MGLDEGGRIWGSFKMLNPRKFGFLQKQFTGRLANHLQNHSKLGSLLSLLKLLLSLPKLCKVESCNLFSLLYLLLVGFDLPLKLCSKFRHAVLVLPIFSRGLSARAKSSPLPKEKIGRTRTACLNLLQSSKGRSKPTNSRWRRLKRLQLSTLQSSGRLNKSSRRLRREQSLLWFCKCYASLLENCFLQEPKFSRIQHLRRPLKFPPPTPYPTKSMIDKEDRSSAIISKPLKFPPPTPYPT